MEKEKDNATTFTLEVDLSADTFQADAPAELGRILRYWAGNLRHYDLAPGTTETIYDSAYNQAGTWRIRISPKDGPAPSRSSA